MGVESDLYGYLSTYAGLTALISTRIYPLVAPQNVTKPYCTYQKISLERKYSHQGFSDLQRPRLQVSCYGETYGQARTVADQLIVALEAWPGAANIQAVFVENEIDLYDYDTGLHYTPVDFYCYYG